MSLRFVMWLKPHVPSSVKCAFFSYGQNTHEQQPCQTRKKFTKLSSRIHHLLQQQSTLNTDQEQLGHLSIRLL
jgi:hypothetical protein